MLFELRMGGTGQRFGAKQLIFICFNGKLGGVNADSDADDAGDAAAAADDDDDDDADDDEDDDDHFSYPCYC